MIYVALTITTVFIFAVTHNWHDMYQARVYCVRPRSNLSHFIRTFPLAVAYTAAAPLAMLVVLVLWVAGIRK